MAIYIFLLIGVIVAGAPLCSSKGGKSGRIIYCCAAAVVFIFISAMRFQVGYDYNLYGSKYFGMKYLLPEDLMYERMEKGFVMPLYVLNLGFEDYKTVFVYTSIIMYASLFYLIYKNSSNPWISTAAYLCFGLFFNSLCFLRQVIAATIVTYAMKYYDRKNPIRFFVLVIAASSFHWSALLMLLMFFLLKIKPGYIYLGIITVGTIIFCIFSKTFMYWAIDHFAMYKGYDPELSVEASGGLSPKYTIMFGILFVICFVFRKKLIEKNPLNSAYINCLMYSVVFEAMGMRHAILSRFTALVYLPPILYLVPDLVTVLREYVSEKFSQKGAKSIQAVNICAMSVLALFFGGSYVMLMLDNYNGVVPYVSQIDKPYEIFLENIITEEDNEQQWIEEDEEWLEDDEEWLEEQLELEDGSEPESTDMTVTDSAVPDIPDTAEETDNTVEVEEEYDTDDDFDEDFDEEQFEKDILEQLNGLSCKIFLK